MNENYAAGLPRVNDSADAAGLPRVNDSADLVSLSHVPEW